ncbi:MAG: GTP 3',8-cyclase MoaA [Cellvibrionaceae bacterium]
MLTDQFGRTINYLRLSVTDRCDFRCVYCMAEEMVFLPREELLTLEEMTTIAQAFSELGVSKIRLTGGEPLIRRNVSELLANLGKIQTLEELTLTTNGSQLTRYVPDLLAAGVKRINVSLDSLHPERFHSLTRTGVLDTVLNGIDSALDAGIKVKLNSVILKNRNSDEVIDLVDFVLAKAMDISFIEEMPLGHISEHKRKEEFISSAELRDIISTKYQLTKEDKCIASAGPSDYWSIKQANQKQNSRIGFISPHSNNFCASCNRVRLTSTGQLLLCLGNEHSVDLKTIVTAYPEDTVKLKEAIIQAMAIKPERHHFELDEEPSIVRFMNTTGG